MDNLWYVECGGEAAGPEHRHASDADNLLSGYLAVLASYFARSGTSENRGIEQALSMLPSLAMVGTGSKTWPIEAEQGPRLWAMLNRSMFEDCGEARWSSIPTTPAQSLFARMSHAGVGEMAMFIVHHGASPILFFDVFALSRPSAANSTSSVVTLALSRRRDEYRLLDGDLRSALQFLANMSGMGMCARMESLPCYLRIPG